MDTSTAIATNPLLAVRHTLGQQRSAGGSFLQPGRQGHGPGPGSGAGVRLFGNLPEHMPVARTAHPCEWGNAAVLHRWFGIGGGPLPTTLMASTTRLDSPHRLRSCRCQGVIRMVLTACVRGLPHVPVALSLCCP